MVVMYVVSGVVLVGLIFTFIVSLRGQSLAYKQIGKLQEVHVRVLDHLCAAANPEAWLAQQSEQHYQERREEAKSRPETPDPEGVF